MIERFVHSLSHLYINLEPDLYPVQVTLQKSTDVHVYINDEGVNVLSLKKMQVIIRVLGVY